MRTTSLTLASLLALTLGASAQTATKSETTTTTTAAPAATKNVESAASGVEVGISRRDGITYSDGETYVTRNGIMEKLVRELELPGGVKVAPDGNVTLPDKSQFRLRANQMVTLAGVVQVIPAVPSIVTPVAPAAAPTAGTTSPAGNSAPSRDTSQATITGNAPATAPDRVGAGSQAK